MLLFHLKSSFHSQDISILILTIWSCRKNGLIRKRSLISKFKTSQPCFFKNYTENEAGRLAPDLLLFFKKALYEVNVSGLQLNFNKTR